MKGCILSLSLPLIIFATGWPVGDPDQVRPIGNSWGAIQTFYEDEPYMHPGVDVMGVSQGQPVYAVAPGIVRAWLTISGDYHWRLAIADSVTTDSSDGWLYAHIDPSRDHVEYGDWVEEGDLIGYVVPWPAPSAEGAFHHLHWAKIRDYGEWWSANWLFIDNPTPDLDPYLDTIPPRFENALGQDIFAFRGNNSTNYLSPDSLYGDVDIISKMYDKTGVYWEDCPDTFWEHLAPYQVSYSIHGPQSTELVRSFLLDGFLQDITLYVDLIYSYDFTCRSSFGDGYTNREYFYILTNTDGDSLREHSDYDSCWHTDQFPDGDYWVVVKAADAAGNSSTDSMKVTLVNGNPAASDEIVASPSFKLLTPVVSGETALSFICPLDQELVIFDACGRKETTLTLSGSPKPQSIDVSNLTTGVYFIHFASSETKQYKFVVAN